MEDSPQSDPTTTAEGATGVVVIDVGGSAQPYLRVLTNLSRVRVIGFLDLSNANGDAAGATADLRSTDPRIATEWDGVDAFVHCGRLAGDPESVAVVAASGKPLFVDSRAGRRRADAQTVRACIETGEIGRVVFARFAAAGEHFAWQQQAHVLDMLGWWIGEEPDTVYAQRNHDHESVTVRYVDGATAVCDISSAGPSYREVALIGESASMSLTWADHSSVLLSNGAAPQYLHGSPPLDAVLDAWLDDVRTGTAPIIDASELEAAVALDGAIELSFASGQAAKVKAPQDDGSRA
ncbi:MAG: hypothetical protein WD990_00785 [Acidimicrobiia bacterium]